MKRIHDQSILARRRVATAAAIAITISVDVRKEDLRRATDHEIAKRLPGTTPRTRDQLR